MPSGSIDYPSPTRRRSYHHISLEMTGRSTSGTSPGMITGSSSGPISPIRSSSMLDASSSALTPLVRDPHHILPISAPVTPRGSPPLSRRNSPMTSPRPSFNDIDDYNGTVQSSSTPRSSISTITRSDSRSSDDDDFSPPLSRYHAPSWFRTETSSVSPKVSTSRSRIPTPPRIITSGPRRLRRILDLFGSSNTSLVSSGKTKEREKLMDGYLSPVRRKDDPRWFCRIMAFVPTTPWGFVSFLFFFGCFAVALTMTLKFILDPDKEALPWREYCAADYPTLYSLQRPQHHHSSTILPFGHSDEVYLAPLTHSTPAWPFSPHLAAPHAGELQSDLSDLAPVGVFVGVFTYDAAVARRNMIRMSYASHSRSRTLGTEGVRLRFIMGQPSPRLRKAVELEMEAFNDIVILDIKENMNSGKTHAYFTWAAEHAMVDEYEYASNDLPLRASLDDITSQPAPVWKGERRPQYIVKADDDAFLMLGELERRLRVAPRSMAYWGYLVKNKFMGGQCYGLSLDLAQYIASSPPLRHLTHGKEDKLVSRWMRMHPQRENIVWVSEKCGIYDHPKASTVYSHGFLYPSEIANIQQEQSSDLDDDTLAVRGGEYADAYSSVSRFGLAFRDLAGARTAEEKVESLIEGSPLSQLRDYPRGPPVLMEHEWKGMSSADKAKKLFDMRPARTQRYMGDAAERGGTVVVHYIKTREWFIETMVAMLGTAEEQRHH